MQLFSDPQSSSSIDPRLWELFSIYFLSITTELTQVSCIAAFIHQVSIRNVVWLVQGSHEQPPIHSLMTGQKKKKISLKPSLMNQ